MLGDDETTTDDYVAEQRNYKVELWDERDRIERMLFAGTSLDKARAGVYRVRAAPAGGGADDSTVVPSARAVAEGRRVR